jgi:hypothetical protein
MSERARRSDRRDEGAEPSRHPSYDPSGDEPAGSSTGLPGRDFAEAEAEQARGRRESMASRDNTALGPHDQESGDRSGRRDGPEEGIDTEKPR